jgi:hypothetical protein
VVPPRDTSREAFEAQLAQLRSAGPTARLAMAADMSDAVIELAAAAVRRRHPDYDATQVAIAMIEQLYSEPLSTASET